MQVEKLPNAVLPSQYPGDDHADESHSNQMISDPPRPADPDQAEREDRREESGVSEVQVPSRGDPGVVVPNQFRSV